LMTSRLSRSSQRSTFNVTCWNSGGPGKHGKCVELSDWAKNRAQLDTTTKLAAGRCQNPQAGTPAPRGAKPSRLEVRGASQPRVASGGFYIWQQCQDARQKSDS
jgi:hypothetical protein